MNKRKRKKLIKKCKDAWQKLFPTLKIKKINHLGGEPFELGPINVSLFQKKD